MASEPTPNEPRLTDTRKREGIVVNKVTAIAALAGVALIGGAVGYAVAYSLSGTIACRRTPIPAENASECLDTPHGCAVAVWSTISGCSLGLDSDCICFQGQTRSCVPGDSGTPKQICNPGSSTCGVQFCQLNTAGEWRWEHTCHTL
jgi:hypothetical protein